MSIVYFTTNADSGDGSLRNVLASAEDGDVIMPSPVVFNLGETITINMVSTCTIEKDVDVKGNGRRIRLVGMPVSSGSNFTVRYKATNKGTIEDVDFADLTPSTYAIFAYRSSTDFECFARRCSLFNWNTTGAQAIGGKIQLEDCLIFNIKGQVGTGATSFKNCTACFNVNGITSGALKTDCVDSSNSLDFVNSPSNAPTDDTWESLDFDDYNFNLVPTSQYATGNVGTDSVYDLYGNKRLVGGALGALECYDVTESGKVKAFWDSITSSWKDKRFNGNAISDTSSITDFYVFDKNEIVTVSGNVTIGGFCPLVTINGTASNITFGLGDFVILSNGEFTFSNPNPLVSVLASVNADITIKDTVNPLQYITLTQNSAVTLKNCTTNIDGTFTIPSSYTDLVLTISGGSFTVGTLELNESSLVLKDAVFSGNVYVSSGKVKTDYSSGSAVLNGFTFDGAAQIECPDRQYVEFGNSTLTDNANVSFSGGYLVVSTAEELDNFNVIQGYAIVKTPISSIVAQIDGTNVTLEAETSTPNSGGLVIAEYKSGDNWLTLGTIQVNTKSAISGVIPLAETVYPIRVFDGVSYVDAETGRTYYYCGNPSQGSFTTPSDWSVTSNRATVCTAAPQIQYGIFDARTTS